MTVNQLHTKRYKNMKERQKEKVYVGKCHCVKIFFNIYLFIYRESYKFIVLRHFILIIV